MADFIPGESYRLDIVTADETVIVDSWQGKIKADVVSDAGLIQVDVSSGRLYGPMIGDIEDTEGNVIFDMLSATLKGSLKGDVYDSSGSQKLIDGNSGRVLADVVGNILDSDGNNIVDTANGNITATRFNGDLYGDVYGNISSDSVIYGTFSGDFNGTAYGEFFGDTVGTHTGDVIGDVTGQVNGLVVGDLQGDLLVMWPGNEEPVPLNRWSDEWQQWDWNGGIGTIHKYEESIARGPVLTIGENRQETALRCNINGYDGYPVMKLHLQDKIDETGLRATFIGNYEGNFIYRTDDNIQDVLTASNQGTVLHAVNGNVTIGGYINEYEESDLNIFSDFITVETTSRDVLMNVKSYAGTLQEKTAVSDGESIIGITGQVYNGTDYVDAGGFGLFVDGNPISSNNYANSKFMINLPNNSQSVNIYNQNILEYDSNGVLAVPVFKAKGTTFADRDSMSAEAGMIIFNKSNNKFQGYTGTTWVDLH